MKHRLFIIIDLFLLLSVFSRIYSQEKRTLTLQEAIVQAQQHSPAAIAARHSFRAAYWSWRSFRANLLPSLILTSNPMLNRSISSITRPDGSDSFVHRNQLSIDAGLTVNQNIPFTGGSLSVSTALQRLDLFSDDSYSYKSTPISISYAQDLFGYNALKWDRRIEPVRYTEARKNLIETLELVAAQTTYKFFQLVTAQTNLDIAIYNHANADTLYRFAQGRYNIGTITENEMLQLELNLLTAQTNRMNAQIEIDDNIQELRSYLGMIENIEIKALLSDQIPCFHVPVDEALSLAYENNPEPETLLRRKLESESAVAQAKASRGFKADLYVQFGLTQADTQLKEAYRSPLDQQLVSLGIRIPILDWGVGKGRVKVALSNRDKVYTEIDQSRTDFELNVVKLVKQFNLQTDKVHIAYKTDETARLRNEVAHKLYLLGKSDILDLNASIDEKDRARRSYITSIYQFWNLYYGLRSLTGYDFEKHQALNMNYEDINQ